MNSVVIGTFRGKCCDAEVYNNNGMLLNRDLFNILINSDDYKRAMKNRYYIGFLGHPEDPNDMNFKNACIIMTSMEMLENGEIWGTFDLIDTPVGRVVKTFIDAGVVFGISIRGAGDVDGTGKVDPETFVFRGYDLVTFPAYDDAVPEFTSIAASSDIQKQSRYKKVCATIKTNLSKIQSTEALEIMQSRFDSSSDEFKRIGDRIDELNQVPTSDENCSLMQQKLDALTNLYLQQVQDNQRLFDELNALRLQCTRLTATSERKIRSIERIMGTQMSDLQDALTAAENKCMTLVSANTKLKNQNQQYVSACSDLESRLADTQQQLRSLRKENRRITSASSADSENLSKELKDKQKELDDIKSSNLIYKRKVESTTQALAEKEEIIASLEAELRETVTANQKSAQESLNRNDQKVKQLQARIQSCEKLIGDYQQAYADIYASAVGMSVENIPITSSTSPKELRSFISGSTSTAGMPVAPFVEPEQIETITDEYLDDDTIVAL